MLSAEKLSDSYDITNRFNTFPVSSEKSGIRFNAIPISKNDIVIIKFSIFLLMDGELFFIIKFAFI